MKLFRRYLINGDKYNVVVIEKVDGNFVKVKSNQALFVGTKEDCDAEETISVWKTVWKGVGLVYKSRYLGIFQYENISKDFTHLSKIYGIHLGTIIGQGIINITGINLSGMYGFFNCTWVNKRDKN